VYVRPFPQVDDGRCQVSTGGGAQPVWARNGCRQVAFETSLETKVTASLITTYRVESLRMTISPGTRVGPYEVTALIGEGGMGKVWRAHHTALKRDDALKVLPDAFAADPERLARFQREAEVLASLNHPNIAHVFGLEDAFGIKALVMELVEGPTLADRIAQGPIPLDEALPIARQIAEALEAAHEQGIVHRDLKPANIKLRLDGAVKVLDFGLAKAMDRPPGESSNISMSPTITTPAMTHAGFIMGTAPYMSPEQAKGKPADRRADIWAFGVVLCEMFTGQQLFTGETAAETLAGVMKDEPKLDTLPATVRPIVERCLRRDLRKRWQAIGDVRIALEEGAAATVTASPLLPPRFWTTATFAWIVASLAVAGAVVLAFVHFRETPRANNTVRFQVAPPETSVITSFAVSPDGRYLAFISGQGGRQLWVRPVDSLDARALPGTDGASPAASQIFWSPDSRFIGFVAQGKLKKVSVNGGPPQSLADADSRTRATWGREGVILFSAGPLSPIQRVPEAGGVSVAMTKPAPGENHFTPQFLPDGRRFLYYVSGGKPESNGVYVSSLEDSAQPMRLLPDASTARYAPPPTSGGSGHLLFVREATLMAQPFDPETLQLTGEVFPVAEPVIEFAVSESGELAYMSGATAARQELVWVDRSGKQIETAGPPGDYGNFRLSPDEKSIVFNRIEFQAGNADIWVLDMTRSVPSRISFDPGVDNLPIWSHDGLRILWPSNRSGRFDLYIKAATGAGQDELFIKMGTPRGWGTDWSRDGRFVLYQRPSEKGDADLWIAPQYPERSGGEQKPVPYLQSPFNEENAVFSPDGRWIAYVSDESGRQEVYVQAFPLTNEKDRISSGGGTDPAWRGDGNELFYLAADRNLMAVPVRASATAFEPGAAKVLFPIPGNTIRRAYEPSGDGGRFLIARPMDEAIAVPITVVLNWYAGIKN
jgi:eukaryotic-like serine/threonine-protein kinase